MSGALTYLLPDAPAAAGRPQQRVTVQNKHYDPHAAPPGKSALTVFLESEYGFWKPLEADRPAYEAEKRRCADLAVDAIGRHRPGFAEAVEVVDVSTPLTRERYTGNWLGAMQAFRPDAGIDQGAPAGRPALRRARPRRLLPAGQWVETWGGVTTAAQSGRNAVRALCKNDGARFAY